MVVYEKSMKQRRAKLQIMVEHKSGFQLAGPETLNDSDGDKSQMSANRQR